MADPITPPSPPAATPQRRPLRLALGFVLGAQAVMLMPARWLVTPDAISTEQVEVWACPMLCVRLHHAGRCPVCGMALERMAATGGDAHDRVVVPADQARTLGLRTITVERRPFEKRIHASGVIDYSDTRLAAGDVFAGATQARALALLFDLFDAEVPWVVAGQEADIELDARPGVHVKGVVDAVALGVTRQTRATRVRIVVSDPDGALGVGMFARATISAVLGADGRAVGSASTDRYTCRVHTDVRSERPGACPKCQLPLWIDPAARTADRGASKARPAVLVVPRDAVVRRDRRQLVYVEVEPRVFAARAVRVGPRSDSEVMILDGLEEGDEIVAEGSFLIDSHLRLAGDPGTSAPAAPAAVPAAVPAPVPASPPAPVPTSPPAPPPAQAP